jgi:hypothetical protein
MAQLTTEELQQIKDLQSQYNKNVFELGSIEAQLQGLTLTKTEALASLSQLGELEKQLVEGLQTKYGAGNIDIQTGEITPVQA